ncbi:glutathione S-transferase family protein [Candidatus Synchoanobacter obligatus]|uniref:Glutathione S-transferase family protein n=1 Tax=Candidatus Synchoanobacter obligatus TaxID=2919597 RepID=A0ABT1L5L5_9GAMM|nr:glutathione S-transferase family protein [Candidatus Synchoanobacter obligatus]MCP8352020.1 glutathione S-transferase family protein [Candidatus Synchoanobacter obligatus]
MQTSHPILWDLSLSPYVRKVIAALEEKNLNYTLKETLPIALLKATGKPIDLSFSNASPLGKIPALQDGTTSVADSAVIAQFIDKKYSQGTSLYPSDPKALAKTLWFEQYSDNILSSVAYSKIFIEKIIKPNVLNISTDESIVSHAIESELLKCIKYYWELLYQI